MDIEELIERSRQGDEEALAGLYAAYHRQVAGICRRIVGNREVAEELAHDAFLLAFGKLEALRSPQAFPAWLASIATHLALRYKQRHPSPVMLPLDSFSEDLIGTAEPSDMESLPSFEELMEVVDGLPKGYGQVFKMAVIQKMSHQEIGERLGIAAHSSSSQLARAKKMLRKVLAPYRALALLLLLLPVALYLFLFREAVEAPPPIAVKPEEQPDLPAVRAVPSSPRRAIRRKTRAVRLPLPLDWAVLPQDTSQHPLGVQEAADTSSAPAATPLPDVRPSVQEAVGDAKQPLRRPSAKYGAEEQALAFSCSGSPVPSSDQKTLVSLRLTGESLAAEPEIREVWSWKAYLDKQSGSTPQTAAEEALLRIAQANVDGGEDEIRRTAHHDLPLILSLSFRRPFHPRWGMEAGLQYSRLSSRFTTGTPEAGVVETYRTHYMGLPVSVSYQWLALRQWSLYSSLGATLEFPVRSTLVTDYRLHGRSLFRERGSCHAPCQGSVGVGVGLHYRLTPHVGLFVEPRLQYYIPAGSKVETYRTAHPFSLALPMGVRLTW